MCLEGLIMKEKRLALAALSLSGPTTYIHLLGKVNLSRSQTKVLCDAEVLWQVLAWNESKAIS